MMERRSIQTFPWNFSSWNNLSVVDFVENYTFAAQKEIQSEYYHSDQVSIFVHVLYRHSQQDVDGIESTCENQDVIK